MITWEPWLIPPDSSNPQNQPQFSLKKILSGQYDHYIEQFAHAVARFGNNILLRPMHEMNGFWYPWCGTVNGNTPADFIKTWFHLQKIFTRIGTTNVKWIWSPYASSYPDNDENRISAYFPGDEFLDIAALDGYNWGNSREWGVWREFPELFGNGYDEITLLTSKPLMIAETGCTEEGGCKAEWLEQMFSSLGKRFSAIEALVWFDVDKECDWRISSSPLSCNAFRTNAPRFFGK
jgi:beta-mannanase